MASTTTPSTVVEEQPVPPRFWWLKGLSLAGLLLVVAMAGLRGWWGFETQRRVDKFVASIHARGEPILPEDFASATLSDNENAATLFKQAAGMYVQTPLERDFNATYPYSPKDLQSIATMVGSHAGELQLLRLARGRPRVEWGLHLSHPINFMTIFSGYNTDRRLAVLLQQSALYAHSTGDDGAATEFTLDVLALGRAEARRSPLLISSMVSIGIDSLGLMAAREISPFPFVNGIHTATTTPATRDQVKALIADLEDERPFRESIIRNWMGERMVALDAGADWTKNQVGLPRLTPAFDPMFQLEALHLAKSTEATISAMKEDNFPAALSKVPPVEHQGKSSVFSIVVGLDMISLAPDRFTGFVYRHLAERRAVATILALRLYAFDHAGELPGALTELVPQYLSTVPIDPFAAVARPLAYLPNHDPAVIYSVGFNGTDEGGHENLSKSIRLSDLTRWESDDAVFPIWPDNATTQPAATQAGN